MSLAKVSTGNGFQYYMEVTASHDAPRRRGQSLDGYYADNGEPAGVWMGSGLTDLNIAAGDPVTEAQMRALIGEGLHPDADTIIANTVAEQIALGAKPKHAITYAMNKVRLGTAYSRFTTEPGGYRHECATAVAAWNTQQGNKARATVPAEVRSTIRNETAERMFLADKGRAADSPQELARWIEQALRPAKTAVAAWDLTFSPVKSVSVLWALAPTEIAAQIEAAHHQAIRGVLDYLERTVLYTRMGRGGLRRVQADGLVATRFDHRDSRAGDPDLHSHVVVSNRVRRPDRTWGAIDGTTLYQYNVSCSELYNTLLEAHLGAEMGLVFANRPDTTSTSPIREIIGVEQIVSASWSKRRRQITAATDDRAQKFRTDYDRDPSTRELYRLSQNATLTTREGKRPVRPRAEQRSRWRAEAAAILGNDTAVDAMVMAALSQQRPTYDRLDGTQIQQIAECAAKVVAGKRETWQHHHVVAEVARQLRGRIAPDACAQALEQVTTIALLEPFSTLRADRKAARSAVYSTPQRSAAV